MCDWNSGPLPSAFRFREASSNGRRNPSTFPGWQWSVCSAIRTSCFSASRWIASASTIAPKAASFTANPDANSPPPVETWMIPSDFASENAFSAPLAVVREVTLMAG